MQRILIHPVDRVVTHVVYLGFILYVQIVKIDFVQNVEAATLFASVIIIHGTLELRID